MQHIVTLVRGGANFRALREAAGVPLEGLAAAAGVPLLETFMTDYGGFLRSETAIKFSRLIGQPFDDLFDVISVITAR